MIEIVRLAPHDELPTGPTKNVIVLHRFDEDAPRETVTVITLTGHPDENTHPRNPDGQPMQLEEAIEAAKKVAESEGLTRIFVADRTQGDRERDILSHGGDHSVNGEGLQDFDLEDGVRGSDLRDRRA
jgi:hypothetical protein